jgi:murein DD-endopeptidase MepM/ murein hydrolase activator NlpD
MRDPAGREHVIGTDMRTSIPLIPTLACALLLAGCTHTVSYMWNGNPAPLPGPVSAESSTAVSAGGPSAADPRPAARDLALSSSGSGTLASHNLTIPVFGVRADQLSDSFNSPRSDGREHHAIDILAPRGTPVLSADNGKVLRVSSNTLGGLTVYAADRSGQFVYYYAHLEGYARGLKAGHYVLKGDTLGFVGTTGDAPENTPHLHFQILRMPPDGQYWNGEAIDPYPLLMASGTPLVGKH